MYVPPFGTGLLVGEWYHGLIASTRINIELRPGYRIRVALVLSLIRNSLFEGPKRLFLLAVEDPHQIIKMSRRGTAQIVLGLKNLLLNECLTSILFADVN